MRAQAAKMLREEAILLSLTRLDYLSRSQIQRLHNLAGDRNARRVLAAMAPYLSTMRCSSGENVYYLNKLGRERMGSDVIRTKTLQVEHYLMRADAFIHYAGNDDWRNEPQVGVVDVVSFKPDAAFRYNKMRHFLEVDCTQAMTKNREKIDRYRKLAECGVIQKKTGYFPRLVWVTVTEARRKQLAAWCAGMDVVIHVWDEIK